MRLESPDKKQHKADYVLQKPKPQEGDGAN
jgi:hypothetical protein